MPVFATVIAFVAFVILHWLNIMPKIRAVAALVAGAGITAGVIGRVMRAGAAWLTHLAGTATAVLLGAAIPAALAISLLIIFVHDMHPRRKASRRTALIGFALPITAVLYAAAWVLQRPARLLALILIGLLVWAGLTL